jgi:SEC-C motif-containing protein
MRARYSAYVTGDVAFLRASWHPGTRPSPEQFALDPDIQWRRLLIESTAQGGPFSERGTVTFTAIGRTPEGRFEQREQSRFLRGGPTGWLYVDGDPVE